MATTHPQPTDDLTLTTAPGADTPERGGDVAAARRALLADAVGSLSFAILFMAGAPLVRDHLGIPLGWSIGLGVFTLAYAADLLFVARGLPRRMGVVRGFAFGNLGWVAGSILVVGLGVWPLTTLGVAFVLLQAAVVAGYAVAQLRAVR